MSRWGWILGGMWLLSLPVQAAKKEAPRGLEPFEKRIQAKSVLLVDAASNQVIFSKNHLDRHPPASTIKLMTALLAHEKTGLRGLVTVTEEDTHVEPSHIPLKVGETISVQNLVKALLVGSDNDSAMALARHTAGTVPKFIDLMNQRAFQLGCKSSVFRNPHGLPTPGQVTTTVDLLRIFQTVLRIPELRRICQLESFELETKAGRQVVKNHNKLLGVYPGMGPAKTGWTYSSRHTYAASASRGGRELHLIILNSPDKWTDAKLLFDYGFEHLPVILPPTAVPESNRPTTL